MDSFLSNAAALHTPGCSSSLQQISSTNCAVMLSARSYALFRESWKCTVCLQYEGVLLGFLLKKKMQFVGKAVLLQKVMEKYNFFLCSLRSDCICAAILQRTWARHVASVLPQHETHYFLVAECVTLTTNFKKIKKSVWMHFVTSQTRS